MRLAVTGPMFSGKTSLAEYLRDEHGWTVLSYTDDIKSFGVVGLNAVEDALRRRGIRGRSKHTVDGIRKNKKQYRKFLQEFGTFFGFDDGFYVEAKLNEWKSLGSPEPVIFDNVRTPEQWEVLQGEGFVLFGLEISAKTQLERAELVGVSREELWDYSEHACEQGVEAELNLNGETETEVLADIFQRLAGIRLSREGRINSVAA